MNYSSQRKEESLLAALFICSRLLVQWPALSKVLECLVGDVREPFLGRTSVAYQKRKIKIERKSFDDFT